MATATEITSEDVRSLIVKGWIPPPAQLEPYRHLLRPFYDAKGWSASGKGKLDESDVSNLVALVAVFDHFGIAIPSEAPPAAIEAAPWVTVLRAYVAEHDGFTTEDAVKAVGLEGTSTGRGAVTDALESLGLVHHRDLRSNMHLWTKRRAA